MVPAVVSNRRSYPSFAPWWRWFSNCEFTMYVKYAIGVTNFKSTSGAGGCVKILCKN